MVMRAFPKRRYHPPPTPPHSTHSHCIWYGFVNYDCTQYFNTGECTPQGRCFLNSNHHFFYVIIITFLLIDGT